MNENETPETPPTVAVAKLDGDGVYHGIEQIPSAWVRSGNHVLLPDGCDLPPGRYRWDRAAKSFVPLADAQQRAVEAPVALNALAWGLLAMHGAGMRLPGASLSWLDFYVKTIDFAYTEASEAELRFIQDYAAERGLK